tara:strand:+ start:414 stop:1712 length:1299 start_codon:yes stop_codon:yes gene_type:complete
MQNTESTLISMIAKLPDLFRQRADSLAEFSAITHNEYITLVEDSLQGADYLPGLLEHLQTLLGCNMLSAISLLTGVPEVDVLGTLDKVSTKRDPLNSALTGGSRLAKFIGSESSRIGLPTYENLPMAIGESSRRNSKRRNINGDMAGNNASQKSYNSNSMNQTTKNSGNTSVGDNSGNVMGNTFDNSQDNRKISNYNNDSSKGKRGQGFGKDNMRNLTEASDLSTGKQFGVTFERDGNKAEVLMTLRLAVMLASTDEMQNLLTLTDQTNTFSERRLKVKAGQLKFWKDLVFCNDLIEQARKNRFKDKTGYYRRMMDRRSSNWLSGLLSFDMSINNASAIMIVEQDTVDGLAAEMGGDFDEFAVRKQVFDDTLTVYIAVVDTRFNQITIYTRGMDEYTTLSVSDLKGKGGKGGGNVDDIIRAYTSGSNPNPFG